METHPPVAFHKFFLPSVGLGRIESDWNPTYPTYPTNSEKAVFQYSWNNYFPSSKSRKTYGRFFGTIFWDEIPTMQVYDHQRLARRPVSKN
jgi:hypothetical protein